MATALIHIGVFSPLSLSIIVCLSFQSPPSRDALFCGWCVCVKLQALVYDILPSTTAVFSYAIGSRKLSANEQFLLLLLLLLLLVVVVVVVVVLKQ